MLNPEARLKHYILKNQIAAGGMGVVWRALDTRRNELVAIKAIANDYLGDPEFQGRFSDEVRRHSRLSHPNIVPVLDVFEAEGQSCLAMDLVDGQSLTNLLDSKDNHRLELDDAIPILEDVLGALDYAHRHGIVHRDIKPSNVLLDREGRAHLIDFGVALAVGEKRRTRTGLAVGTPDYMSPEQIVRPKSIDHRSDVYSVGCLFYEMLTGQPPFTVPEDRTGDTDFAIKKAHINEKPVPPADRVASIPEGISELILWALEKDRNQRLPGCGEFARSLEEVAAGNSAAFSKPLAILARHRRLVYVIGGVLLLAALISTIVLLN